MALQTVKIYPNSHYVTPKPTLHQAIKEIQHDLKVRLAEFEAEGKLLEAQRLEQRTQFDIEMMLATGAAPASRTIPAISPAANRASRRRPCSSTCPTTRC